VLLCSSSSFSSICRSFFLVLIILGCSAGLSHAQDGADRRLGISLAEEGRCEPALEVLARVQTDPASDAEVAQLDGACSLRLKDFRRAIASFEIARDLDPTLDGIDRVLGMAYYHAGQIEDAADALVRAGAVDGSNAEFLLYSGLVAYAQTDYTAAAGRLDAASQLSEAPVEPMASFFLGRAELGADNRDRAKTAFERVIRDYSGTAWADEAARALEELEASSGIQWWANAEVGLEHDDNPLLRGGGVLIPTEIASNSQGSQSDQRVFWFTDVGATLFERGDLSGGAMLRYAGSEHFELERFDTHAPGGTVWFDYELGIANSSLRVQYDFDAAFIDSQSIDQRAFVTSHLVGASIYKPWEDGVYTLLSSSVGFDDYGYDRIDVPDTISTPDCTSATFCGPPINEADKTDRDGVGVSVSVLHHVPIASEIALLNDPFVQGEYRYQRYWSEGSEFDQQRHAFEIGLGAQLPLEIGFRLSGHYAYAPYGNASVFPDPRDIERAPAPPVPYFLSTRDREEHQVGVRASLERAFGNHVVGTLRYSRMRNYSNADVFSYVRDLIGISFRVGFGGS